MFYDDNYVISVYGSHLNATGDVWCRFTLPSKTGGSYYYETSRVSSTLGDGQVDCAIPAYPSTSNCDDRGIG